MRAGGGELFLHQRVKAHHIFFREIATRDARLVRRHQSQDVVAVEIGHRLDRARAPAQIFRQMRIAGIFDQHAVTVENYGAKQCASPKYAAIEDGGGVSVCLAPMAPKIKPRRLI